MSYQHFRVKPAIIRKGIAVSFDDEAAFHGEVGRLVAGGLACSFKVVWSVYARQNPDSAGIAVEDCLGDYCDRQAARDICDRLNAATRPHASPQTYMAVWEALLDHPKFEAIKQDASVCDLRDMVTEWTPFIDRAWGHAQTAFEYDSSFDWEFVPAVISAAWTIADRQPDDMSAVIRESWREIAETVAKEG
ncbi:MAG: hypothetical protein ACK4K8_00340 [Pannonibacter sp.]